MHQLNDTNEPTELKSCCGEYGSRPLGVKITDRLSFTLLVGIIAGYCSCIAVHAHAAEDFAPFPPGENATLAKKTCTECHAANVVISTQYDQDLARKQYKKYVGDPDSEDARKVINYLTTVLGVK